MMRSTHRLLGFILCLSLAGWASAAHAEVNLDELTLQPVSQLSVKPDHEHGIGGVIASSRSQAIYAVVASSQFGGDDRRISILKFPLQRDALPQMIYSRPTPASKFSHPFDIHGFAELSDGHLVLLVADLAAQSFTTLKIDPQGQVIAEHARKIEGSDNQRGLLVTSDDEVLLIGNIKGRANLTLLDSQLNLRWSLPLADVKSMLHTGVEMTGRREVIVAGNHPAAPTKPDAPRPVSVLLRVSLEGRLLQTTHLPGGEVSIQRHLDDHVLALSKSITPDDKPQAVARILSSELKVVHEVSLPTESHPTPPENGVPLWMVWMSQGYMCTSTEDGQVTIATLGNRPRATLHVDQYSPQLKRIRTGRTDMLAISNSFAAMTSLGNQVFIARVIATPSLEKQLASQPRGPGMVASDRVHLERLHHR